MKPDYLWDGSGQPDPEIERIEQSLSQLRYSGEMPDFAAIDLARKPGLFASMWNAWTSRLAAAALVLVAIVASGIFSRTSPRLAPDAPGWDVAQLSGTPQVGNVSLSRASRKTQLKTGQLLVTDHASSATLYVAEIGQIYVDSGSRVRLLESQSNQNRLALELGTIHAAIWAPAGEFVVDTPSATAVDLGCAYTLHVDDDGSGTLRTTLGWVGFHTDGHDSFIPAGAMCATRPTLGPGTPYFEDAPENLRAALHSFDFDTLSPDARQQALRTILAAARPRDAFTLWHLLPRVTEQERIAVYDRVAALVKPPVGVTREGTLALNPGMLDAWWNAFELGDISVWRYWEQKQAPAAFKKAAR